MSIFFWLLPPFRQYKGRFFYYFLIMALSDPLTILCFEVLKLPVESIHSVAGLFLAYSLFFQNNNTKQEIILLLSFLLGFIISIIYLTNLHYLILSIHIVIFLFLLKMAILPIYYKNTINIFYFALLFYELSIVLNYTLIMGNSNIKMLLFYMTLFFQILMAIFFTIFTEKSKSMILHIKQIDNSL